MILFFRKAKHAKIYTVVFYRGVGQDDVFAAVGEIG